MALTANAAASTSYTSMTLCFWVTKISLSPSTSLLLPQRIRNNFLLRDHRTSWSLLGFFFFGSYDSLTSHVHVATWLRPWCSLRHHIIQYRGRQAECGQGAIHTGTGHVKSPLCFLCVGSCEPGPHIKPLLFMSSYLQSIPMLTYFVECFEREKSI